MRIKNIVILFCVLTSLLFVDNVYCKPPVFLDNYTQAVKVSQDFKQPLILIFSADWCFYCKKLQKDISANLSQFQDTTICIIDIDKHNDISKEYKIKSIPKTILFDNNQKKIKEINGYFNVRILGKINE